MPVAVTFVVSEPVPVSSVVVIAGGVPVTLYVLFAVPPSTKSAAQVREIDRRRGETVSEPAPRFAVVCAVSAESSTVRLVFPGVLLMVIVQANLGVVGVREGDRIGGTLSIMTDDVERVPAPVASTVVSFGWLLLPVPVSSVVVMEAGVPVIVNWSLPPLPPLMVRLVRSEYMTVAPLTSEPVSEPGPSVRLVVDVSSESSTVKAGAVVACSSMSIVPRRSWAPRGATAICARVTTSGRRSRCQGRIAVDGRARDVELISAVASFDAQSSRCSTPL